MILDGECDDLPESAFLFAGTIDDVFEKAQK
jgi:F-type H+-transporting ATPase subunit beta